MPMLGLGLEGPNAAGRMSQSWIRPQSANGVGMPKTLYYTATHSSLNEQVRSSVDEKKTPMRMRARARGHAHA